MVIGYSNRKNFNLKDSDDDGSRMNYVYMLRVYIVYGVLCKIDEYNAASCRRGNNNITVPTRGISAGRGARKFNKITRFRPVSESCNNYYNITRY